MLKSGGRTWAKGVPNGSVLSVKVKKSTPPTPTPPTLAPPTPAPATPAPATPTPPTPTPPTPTPPTPAPATPAPATPTPPTPNPPTLAPPTPTPPTSTETNATAPESTQLTESVPEGSTVIHVQSETGFSVGSPIKIEDAVNSETNTIASIGSLILATPLKHTYGVGSTVSLMASSETQ